MNEQAQSDLLQEHEVLFLDFMGFAAAVQQWDDHRMWDLIRVLASIADAQSAFDVKGESQSDGSYKITSRPEITTFSDHIVVSYPRIAKPSEITIELWEVLSNGWVGMVREQMQKITAQVAIAALGLGLLVRGGLSRGKLYHHGRVVVGEAMVDAYQLESKVARDARVIVSERISDNDRLFIDTDGKRCLDYIGEMMLLAENQQGDARVWARQSLAEIEATINALTGSGRTNKAAKWVYFKDKLRYAMETWS
jgi:hypothetical protein